MIMSEEMLYELEQLANEAKLRGSVPLGLEVDWRDIPTSRDDIDELTDEQREYWLAVAEQLVSR